jgi:hypothetical protein
MRFTLALFGALSLFGAAAASAGCSGKSARVGASGGTSALGPELAGEGGSFVGTESCTNDTRVDTYTAAMERAGSKGILTFQLVSSEPAPPAKGNNTFQVVVKDSDGMPLGGTLGIDLEMPDHGHGTSVTPVVSLDAGSDAYKITPVYLFMPGVWRVELDFYGDSGTDAKPIDQATFYFCIEG